MDTTYKLYSESLGDWPLVCYYSLIWLAFFLIVDMQVKLTIKETKSTRTSEESKN